MEKKYEVMYIVKPYDKEFTDKIVEKINKIIADNNGTVERTDIWGKKRLAYEIQDFAEGFYVLVTFNSDHNCVRELDRQLRILEDVMRYMIISKG